MERFEEYDEFYDVELTTDEKAGIVRHALADQQYVDNQGEYENAYWGDRILDAAASMAGVQMWGEDSQDDEGEP